MLVDSVRKFLALLLSITVWAVAPGFVLCTPPLLGSSFSQRIAVAEFPSGKSQPSCHGWTDMHPWNGTTFGANFG